MISHSLRRAALRRATLLLSAGLVVLTMPLCAQQVPNDVAEDNALESVSDQHGDAQSGVDDSLSSATDEVAAEAIARATNSIGDATDLAKASQGEFAIDAEQSENGQSEDGQSSQGPDSDEPATSAGTQDAVASNTALEIARGPEQLPLIVPRDERLSFIARLRLGPVDARVGTVTLDSGVEEYRASLLGPSSDSKGETAFIKAQAKGAYTLYSLDSTLETRLLPQAWPKLVHRMTQKGTEQRRRETLIGSKDNAPFATYRADTRTGAPTGTRIWSEPMEFEAPVGALDSLGAVFIVRTMLREGLDEVVVPVLDKHRVWQVVVTLGPVETVDTVAGRFQARPVLLETQRVDAAAEEEKDRESFSGPFGIKGDIRLYVEASSGVPIVIAGTLPAGPLEIELDIRLASFAGTPSSFTTVTEAASESTALDGDEARPETETETESETETETGTESETDKDESH